MEHLHCFSAVEETQQDFWQYQTIKSPVGPLTLIAHSKALLGLLWGEQPLGVRERGNNPILEMTKEQLNEYFIGKRSVFEIPVEPRGTDFQKQVWQELLKIPYGQHITYGEQARRIGRPKAARAVGAANGKNPISIIIPCHRVMGASGDLTGFAGGLEIKRRLLDLEASKITRRHIGMRFEGRVKTGF